MSVTFLAEYFKVPHRVGSVCPSSDALAHCLIEHANLREASSIVEIGPGTGAFTRHLLQGMHSTQKFFAVEINASFVERLRSQYSEADIIHDSAENLCLHLAARGMTGADRILSGLPWTSFPHDLQHRLLHAIHAALEPMGTFVTFAYFGFHWLEKGQAFRKQLQISFPHCHTSPIVWANLPPAFVYVCRKNGA